MKKVILMVFNSFRKAAHFQGIIISYAVVEKTTLKRQAHMTFGHFQSGAHLYLEFHGVQEFQLNKAEDLSCLVFLQKFEISYKD